MKTGKKIATIGLVQTHPGKDIPQNIAKTIQKIEEAVEKGAQIICLQEMYDVIYFPQNEHTPFEEYTETIPGRSTDAFVPLAKKHEVVIVAPIIEKTKSGKIYNSAVVIDADGNILDPYRKVHIPHDPLFYEQNYFESGNNGFRLFKTRYANFAVLICYDQWFPEASRIAALEGAEIIFYPTAIGNIANYTPPEGDWHEAWELIQRSHAIANNIFVAPLNRVGQEGELIFWGQSFVADPFGQVLARASATEEEALVVAVDLSKIQELRDGWRFMYNRKPHTYGKITERSEQK